MDLKLHKPELREMSYSTSKLLLFYMFNIFYHKLGYRFCRVDVLKASSPLRLRDT